MTRKKMVPFDGFSVAVWDGVGCTRREFIFETEHAAILFAQNSMDVITRPQRIDRAPLGAFVYDTGGRVGSGKKGA